MSTLMTKKEFTGVVGFFDDPHSILEGMKKVKAANFLSIDAFTPFPVHGLEAAGLLDARGIRAGSAITVDEQPQHHVALHFPRVQRRRIPEGQVTDHNRMLIRAFGRARDQSRALPSGAVAAPGDRQCSA